MMYHQPADILSAREIKTGSSHQAGTIAVVCAGSSDRPITEETAVAAQSLDNPIARIYDVGIAALPGMLNSRAPGLAVVNINNGFSAACMAHAITLDQNRPLPHEQPDSASVKSVDSVSFSSRYLAGPCKIHALGYNPQVLKKEFTALQTYLATCSTTVTQTSGYPCKHHLNSNWAC